MIIYFIKSIIYDHINKKYNSHEFLKMKSEYVYQVRQNPPKPSKTSAKTRQNPPKPSKSSAKLAEIR
jgi:hypothetical protein